MPRPSRTLRSLKQNLVDALANRVLAIRDPSLTGNTYAKALAYHDSRISDYETRLTNFGKGRIMEVKGLLTNGLPFTIYLCNVQDEEVMEVLKDFKRIDFATPLQLRTIETKTILL